MSVCVSLCVFMAGNALDQPATVAAHTCMHPLTPSSVSGNTRMYTCTRTSICNGGVLLHTIRDMTVEHTDSGYRDMTRVCHNKRHDSCMTL